MYLQKQSIRDLFSLPQLVLLLIMSVTVFMQLSCSETTDPLLCDLTISAGQNAVVLTQEANASEITVSASNNGSACSWRVVGQPSWLALERFEGASSSIPDTLKLTADIFQPIGDYTDVLRLEAEETTSEISVSFEVFYNVTILQGIGAAGIEIGDTYQHIIQILGFSDTFCTIVDPFGSISGHIVKYTNQGISIFLPGTGITPEQDEVATVIIMEGPFADVTRDFLGIGSLQSEVLANFGPPELVDTGDNFWQYNNGLRWYWDGNLRVNKILIFQQGNAPVENIGC
ncbi:MAG: hypothetical protein ACRBF0_11650 [Calditrichia bacterium]